MQNSRAKSTSESPPPPVDCLDLESRARETEEAEADDDDFFWRPMVAVVSEEVEGSWMGRAVKEERREGGRERERERTCSAEVIRISLCSAHGVGVPLVVAQFDSG